METGKSQIDGTMLPGWAAPLLQGAMLVAAVDATAGAACLLS